MRGAPRNSIRTGCEFAYHAPDRRAFGELPDNVKEQARDAYRLFRANPHHPSLRFKQVHPTDPIWSVRIGLGYRAVGIREGDTIYWYWIGSHAEYNRLIS